METILIYDWKKINDVHNKELIEPFKSLGLHFIKYELYDTDEENYYKIENLLKSLNIKQLDFKDDNDGEYKHWSDES